MGCSNARLLVQAPLTGEANAGTTHRLSSTVPTSPTNPPVDTSNTTTRMHLTGVDLVVQRNGSYTLLLTPKTHKQLMPYVLRKKRFRILVDKPRSDPILTSNEPNMENNKEMNENKTSPNPIESTMESIEKVANNEFERVQNRFVASSNFVADDEDEYIQSDDEGMIEEIVTTVEQDKDLECKVKKKIETKKTIAQHPQTHNRITKVVKTEVTEITRTITINDHHDLERAKRELGIDDVNRLLPSSRWIDQSRSIQQTKEESSQPIKETVTTKDLSIDTSSKQIHTEQKPGLAESTVVGRGPVTETIVSEQKPPVELKQKKKKKKSKLCSCTRSVDDDQEQQAEKVISPLPEETKKTTSVISTPTVKSQLDTQIQGQQLISSDIKQLIIDKKFLLIEYIHSKIFAPSKLFSSIEEDPKPRKISSRILDLLRYDRCSSWTQMYEQLSDEYCDYLPAKKFLQPMVNTYENLFTVKQAHLLNTFETIHQPNDIENIQENHNYLNIVQTQINQANEHVKTIPQEQVKQSNEYIANQSEEFVPQEQIKSSNEYIENQPEESVPQEQVIQSTAPDEYTENVQEETISEEQIKPSNGSTENIQQEFVPEEQNNQQEINMTNDNTQKSVPIYNEEYLIKMLGDISQHKPITLAEAIAYQYIDIEDPKLGLSYETIQRIKNLFHPLLDESISNLIRIKRSGEYLTDINLTETNPFEKFTQNDPNIYQLQQTFEPTLDFNEKQFRSFVETILNNKDEYDQLQFDIGRTLLPLYDIKESSTNDFSQSDSGYSMTTATHESLASKIKIEFEPINQDLSESIKQVENDDEEKIDLDKATQEQLDKYELNPDLIQIIKTDFRGTDKTVGQAILSRELRLDSTDPNDISYLNSLGIHKEEARLLTNFFFPKQTRIIAYSPQPGRFVEAQTTYNPDYPGYKTDTTIIQIQEKQLSADPLAMQRSIHDDRQAQQKTETEQVTPVVSTSKIETVTPIPRVSKDNISPLPTPVYIKKRKSSTTRGLLSCFRNKKAKPGTEQQGQPTIVTTRPSIPQQQEQTTAKLTQEKPLVDYSITPDGKRIYIDVFRDRPGLDMSYRPNNFEDRYILPVAKSAAEYERPITPEIPLTETKTETETVTDEVVHTTSQSSASSIIEHKPHVHLEPRPATIEPVDVQPEPTPIVIPSTKSETTRTTIKKSPTLDLHGPAVHLPAVELVEPGLLPALPKTQIKKTTRGLCAACFGVKSSEKKRKDMATTTISSAPIEQKNVEEKRDDDQQQQQEKEKLSTIIEVPSTTSASVEQPILPKVNIDVFKERNFQQSAASLPKSQDQSQTTVEKTTSVAEPHYQLPSNEPVPSAPKNISLFSQVNIDTFRERTFQKGSEGLPKSQERLNTTTEKIIPPPPSAPVEERHYQSPANEPLLVTKSPEPTTPKNTSIFSQVNIDTFRERNFQKSSEGLPKLQERSDITTEKIIPPPPSAPVEEPYYQLPTNEPLLITPAPEPTTPKDASIFSQVNIDTFRDRNFQKSSESLPKSEEPFSEKTTEQVTQSSPSPPPPEPVEEPHYQLPTNEPLLITQAPEPTTPKDASLFSQVNIDTFRERTLQKGSEKISTSPERSQTTPQQVTSSPPPTEEPHYQLPTNEPILVKKSPEPTISKDTSIFSQVNIDTFRERNFQTPPPKFEEPHYQSPSSEPVPPVTISTENEYSVPGSSNTYDIPRSTELQQTSPPSSIQTKTEENIINNETMIPSSTVDNQKSGGDYVVSQSIKEITKTERTSNIQQESPTTKKPKKKKANVLSTLFQSNGQKSTVPALNLPSIERDLSPNNNQTSPSKRHNDDPLHVPSVNLPKLDLPLPSYDRPEVDMTTGSIQQTSEFAIPVVSFPPIPNLSLPENNNNITSSINTNTNHMKIPHVELPELQLTLNNNQTSEPISMEKTIKTNEITVSPINDNTTTYTIKQETITTSETKEIGNETSQEQFTIINTHLVESKEVPVVVEKQTTSGFGFQLPSPEPILIVSKDSKIKPPSFDDDVPSAPSKIVSITIHSSEKSSNEIKKKSSTLALCSCFGNKSHHITKEKSLTIKAPKSSLPAIEMPLPSSNISSTLKPKGPLRAPTNDLPPVDLTPKATELVHLPTPTVIIQSNVVKKENDTSFPTTVEQTKNKSVSSENQPIEEIQPKQSSSPSSFEIKAPIMNIPPIDVSTPAKPEVYISHSKFEQSTSSPEQIQSRSDSGLEAIVSSHVHPSSTFNDIQQYPSVSSGFGSGTLENISADIQSPSPILIPKDNQFIDYNRHITINNEIRQKIDLYENQLKKSVENDLSKSIGNYDKKSSEKLLTHSLQLIKEQKVQTYSDLKQKLIIEHKNDAYIVQLMINSLYNLFENQGIENINKTDISLVKHDMGHLPAKQTNDTEIHLNKEATSLTATSMTKETVRSCLTCGRSKSKTTLPITTTSGSGLLDERRRLQLNTHRNELGNILRDHIQSSQPSIRKFPDHPKEVEKILRKSLTLANQPQINSYEQIRNDLKTEYKQTYYLVDPIVDILRDTFNHCDITQMNEKTNLDILDSNINQTAHLYNNNQMNLLTTEESNAFKSNQLSWLQEYLINNETKEKKLTKKQIKELNKILHRNLEIFNNNYNSTWDDVLLQLKREYPKANDLCQRSVDLLKQAQKDGLFYLQQAPTTEKRRASSLITDRARQNLKTNKNKIFLSLKNLLINYNKPLLDNDQQQLDNYLNKTLNYLEEQKAGQFKTYNDLKEQLKKDFSKNNSEKLIEQIVDVIEQAHATNQFDDIDKPEVQTLMKDRLDGKPLVIKEMYVSLPPRIGAYGDESLRYASTSINGDRTTAAHRVARGLSWREANERARILFYRGKHPAIHYDEQAAAFDVRMLLETASGGTQEIPVTDSDVHELLNSCGVQWDGVNIISLVDHSEDVVRAAEQAALKVIRERGLVDLRTPPPATTITTTTISTKTEETINSPSISS